MTRRQVEVEIFYDMHTQRWCWTIHDFRGLQWVDGVKYNGWNGGENAARLAAENLSASLQLLMEYKP